jgi:hypothetical protein
MSEPITWAAAICSIAGAFFSLYQAWVSKKAADIAQSIKKQLISHRNISELSELQGCLNVAQNSFNKYGASSPGQLRGINHNSDAEVLLQFINKLKSLSDNFSDLLSNVADDTYEEINSALTEFNSAVSNNSKLKHGSKILTAITGFSPHLQRKLTAQKEHTVE